MVIPAGSDKVTLVRLVSPDYMKVIFPLLDFQQQKAMTVLEYQPAQMIIQLEDPQ